MDTLCIPVKPQDEQLRKASINSMASIYAGANETLVLDSELLATPANTHDCLARIICSVWMSRSWTLQEALLSPRCRIPFGNDKAIIIHPAAKTDTFMTWSSSGQSVKMDPESQTGPPSQPSALVWNSLKEYLEDHFYRTRQVIRIKHIQYEYNTRHQRHKNYVSSNATMSHLLGYEYQPPLSDLDIEPPPFPQRELDMAFADCFVSLWNAMLGRSTTMTEDLPLIFANMLDLECGPLMDLPSVERFQSIIFSLPYLPLSLFFNRGPKHVSHKYPLNKWVRTGLDTHPLGRGSTLEFLPSKDSNREHFMRVNSTESLFRILVTKNGPFWLTKFKVQIPGINATITCKIASCDTVQSITDSFGPFCILFEGDTKETNFNSLGAIMLVSSRQSKTVQLTYHCPITVEKRTRVRNERVRLSGVCLSSDFELLVEYSKFPGM